MANKTEHIQKSVAFESPTSMHPRMHMTSCSYQRAFSLCVPVWIRYMESLHWSCLACTVSTCDVQICVCYVCLHDVHVHMLACYMFTCTNIEYELANIACTWYLLV